MSRESWWVILPVVKHNPKWYNEVVKGTPVQRFWAKVNKGKPEDCWLWTAAANRDRGYGVLGINGRVVYAHRFSYELHRSLIPKGLQVRHSCDTPRCVNPAHLSLGTHLDNMTDMTLRGRQNKGESVPTSKLTTQQVQEIRGLCERGGLTLQQVGDMYGVTRQAVSLIKLKEVWSHLP